MQPFLSLGRFSKDNVIAVTMAHVNKKLAWTNQEQQIEHRKSSSVLSLRGMFWTDIPPDVNTFGTCHKLVSLIALLTWHLNKLCIVLIRLPWHSTLLNAHRETKNNGLSESSNKSLHFSTQCWKGLFSIFIVTILFFLFRLVNVSEILNK